MQTNLFLQQPWVLQAAVICQSLQHGLQLAPHRVGGHYVLLLQLGRLQGTMTSQWKTGATNKIGWKPFYCRNTAHPWAVEHGIHEQLVIWDLQARARNAAQWFACGLSAAAAPRGLALLETA